MPRTWSSTSPELLYSVQSSILLKLSPTHPWQDGVDKALQAAQQATSQMHVDQCDTSHGPIEVAALGLVFAPIKAVELCAIFDPTEAQSHSSSVGRSWQKGVAKAQSFVLSWKESAEPTKVIFRFALALFKYKEEEILKLHDSSSIFNYSSCFPRMILDFKKLSHIAFRELNPLRSRTLMQLRATHMAHLKEELREFERLQQNVLSRRDSDKTLKAP
uniref:Uncharacterized protein n=1 Tax=Eptatretus burgeri TaxID=7764 RepID=A0A8C4WV68_EPTBU